MIKIGFDAKRLYNNFTGLGNYSRTLVKNLGEFFPEDDYYLYTPQIRTDPLTDVFLKNRDYHTVCYSGLFKSLWRSWGIRKNLHRNRIDVYHGLSHEIPLHLQKSGIRTVVTIHDLIYRTYPEMFTAIDRTIYDRKFRYACQHADKIIAISESTKRDIIRYFGTPEEKIEVIYQAIQPTFQHLQSRESSQAVVRRHQLPPDYLLYVGAINSRKNLLGIVKALQQLPADLQIPLVIVGNGRQYKEEVIRYARQNRLLDKLIFIANLHDPQELQAFYQEARIFIYPSFYEGFGLPVTEALLSKVPVITSNVSSLPEAGGPASCYVDPTQPEEMATAIASLLTNEERRQEMIEKGFIFAQEQFNARRLTEQVHRLYHRLA